MKNLLLSFFVLIFLISSTNGQNTPTGNPKDFKLKTCLHSVSYMGIWRGQATLPQMRAVPMGEGFLDYKTFINTLKEIGYQGYISYEICEVLKGGGSIENLDKCAKTFLEYVKQFR